MRSLDSSAHDDYLHFVDSVTASWRYVRPRDVDRILHEIVKCAKYGNRILSIASGTEYWRAQLGAVRRSCTEGGVEIDVIPYAYMQKRMTPSAEHVVGGRANTPGIPYLYAASDEATAIAEMRPSRGGHISLSRLATVRGMRIADMTAHDRMTAVASRDLSPSDRRNTFWRLVDTDFARPADPEGRRLEYVPTQIIAEALRAAGYDGIRYTSALGPGKNIVLFDPRSVVIDAPELHQVLGVNYESRHLPHRRFEDGDEGPA